MGAQHEETKHLRIIFFCDLTNRKEITQGFGHFHIVNIQEAIVHPVVCKCLIVGTLGLGDLILMMREDQILATCMDIDLVTQITLGHDRTLNMPAWTTLAPWRLPVWLSFFFRFPQNEIIRVFLAFLTSDLDLTETGL